jgi:hypothetical protein
MGAEIAIPPSTVGLPVELTDVVLPGAELGPVPLDDQTPVVIRVDAVYPHGTDHRYDLVISALEPGTFDLRDYLRRKDGTAVDDLPPLKFTVQTLLPPGQVEPHRPAAARLPWLGGYRIFIAVTGVLWVAVMGWLMWPRRRSAAASNEGDGTVPQSFADRLRPLVSKARDGQAGAVELAELERAVVEYWRRRIGLTDVPPADVISRLRNHPEAAPLLLQLEEWLHRPDTNGRDINVNALLAPYADSPASEREATRHVEAHAM